MKRPAFTAVPFMTSSGAAGGGNGRGRALPLKALQTAPLQEGHDPLIVFDPLNFPL